MTNTQLISKAKTFHKQMGWAPKHFTYTVKKDITGLKVIANQIGTQVSYTVAFFNDRTGKVTKASR